MPVQSPARLVFTEAAAAATGMHHPRHHWLLGPWPPPEIFAAPPNDNQLTQGATLGEFGEGEPELLGQLLDHPRRRTQTLRAPCPVTVRRARARDAAIRRRSARLPPTQGCTVLPTGSPTDP